MKLEECGLKGTLSYTDDFHILGHSDFEKANLPE